MGELFDARLLELLTDIGQLAKVRKGRCGVGAIVEERTALRRTKPQCADAREIMNTEQEVHLLQVAHLATLFPRLRGFASFHEHSAPAIRSGVHEDSEGRRVGRRMLL